MFNERDHIELEIERIRAALEDAGLGYELICVDDGSTTDPGDPGGAPGSGPSSAPQPGLGHGPADRHPAGRGRVVVWTDADMTYPNERIPELVAHLDDTYDQVVGSATEAGTCKLARVPAKWAIRKLAAG